MNKQNIHKLIQISEHLPTPKYRQIINSFDAAIDNGLLKRGEKIPSINQIADEFSLSRDTVMMALNELKTRGIIGAIPGKGYYIASTNTGIQQKIFLLFDELNVFKEDLYNAFSEGLGDQATTDIFFHHFNFQVFSHQILESVNKYSAYIIMPATFKNIGFLLNQLPAERTFILDRQKEELSDYYPCVYQDFENDIFQAMLEGHNRLREYEELILVSPSGKEPPERIKGFKHYCSENNFKHQIIEKINLRSLKKGQALFVTNDRDLVSLVKQAEINKWELGKDIGIVSFNDTALKEVVAGGITTISTDFKQMGNTLANMVLTQKKGQIANPAKLILRNSL